MSIIDRRKNGSGKSAPNRKKFIDRYKRQIKKSVEKAGVKRSIKDTDSVDVEIDKDTTREPDYHFDPQAGKRTRVYSGNDQFQKGDMIPKPDGAGGGGSNASNSGEGEDPFTFQLTKEEFYDIYFDGMELPNFIKESLVGSNKFRLKQAGYTRTGSPAKLNAKKTIELAIARRIASKAQGKEKPAYLDDVDVRYDNIIKKPYPITKALMFCVMDVSGSMYEDDKARAKKFFLLLYLFLTKCYDTVEVRFIRYTDEAAEVDEEEFFYSTVTGGTLTSSALKLMNKIINEEVELSTTNVYVSQASDGDNWAQDNSATIDTLKLILPNIQYMAYIQTQYPSLRKALHGASDLFSLYHLIKNPKLNCKVVQKDSDVYPVLRELFEKAKQ